ncbi:hypothetical protein [Persicobacter psychrovividus]
MILFRMIIVKPTKRALTTTNRSARDTFSKKEGYKLEGILRHKP